MITNVGSFFIIFSSFNILKTGRQFPKHLISYAIIINQLF